MDVPEVEEYLIEALDNARRAFKNLNGFYHGTLFIDLIVLGDLAPWYGEADIHHALKTGPKDFANVLDEPEEE